MISKNKPSDPYYRVDITRYPPLSPEAELELFVDYRKRRTAAKREKIVRQYLYWAAELACRYCGPRMSKPEALSAANYGLMRAIEKFDPALERRFVTFSYFIIRYEVLCALRDTYVVNPDPGFYAARTKFRKTERTPEDEDELKRERREVFDSAGLPVHVSPQMEGGGGDVVGDEFIETDCRRDVEQSSLIEALRASLPNLAPELRQVVELKYFNEGGPLTSAEIGKKLKCTTDHVRWLHTRALKALQKNLRAVKKEL